MAGRSDLIDSAIDNLKELKKDYKQMEDEHEELRRDLEVAEQEAAEGHEASMWKTRVLPDLKVLAESIRDLRDHLWMMHLNESLSREVRTLLLNMHDKLEHPGRDLEAIVRETE